MRFRMKMRLCSMKNILMKKMRFCPMKNMRFAMKKM
ncbi:hypothetical protein A2U01_0074523, partial [Trifolium medium]|nr:hypothetical protein [Trifolium medium]